MSVMMMLAGFGLMIRRSWLQLSVLSAKLSKRRSTSLLALARRTAVSSIKGCAILLSVAFEASPKTNWHDDKICPFSELRLNWAHIRGLRYQKASRRAEPPVTIIA